MERTARRIGEALTAIQHDFLDLPTLHVSLQQAQQRWHLSKDEAIALLGVLIDSGFLQRTATRAYERRSRHRQAA
jgi:hypothetical protein